MALDGQPRQDLQNVPNGQNLTPVQAAQRLKSMNSSGSARYWRQLRVVLLTDPSKYKAPSHQRAMLQCTECDAYLEASNPGRVGKSHFNEQGHCKAACKAAGVAPSAGAGRHAAAQPDARAVGAALRPRGGVVGGN